jgi:hypothetical protein
MPPTYLVQRTLALSPALTVELRVSHGTARLWELVAQKPARLLRSFAAGWALREARDLLRSCGIAAGRWRLTWTEARVVVEPA